VFGNSNNQKNVQQQKSQPKKPAVKDTAVTILTSGCHFSGKLYCRGSSRIGGRIEGQIISEGLLIIEEQALITAEIKADEAVIQGRVKGKLEATGRVELTHTSYFEGDIATPVLVVSEGAQFNGRSRMVVGNQDRSKGIEQVARLNPKGDTSHQPDVGVNEFRDKQPDVAVLKVQEATPT
jgi:cytoskeletal protein CcmA (bactofilin family)